MQAKTEQKAEEKTEPSSHYDLPTEERRHSLYTDPDGRIYEPIKHLGSGATCYARLFASERKHKVVLSSRFPHALDGDKEHLRKQEYAASMWPGEVEGFELTSLRTGKVKDYRLVLPYFEGEMLHAWRCSLATISMDTLGSRYLQHHLQELLGEKNSAYLWVETCKQLYFVMPPFDKTQLLSLLPNSDKKIAQLFPQKTNTCIKINEAALHTIYSAVEHSPTIEVSYIEQLKIVQEMLKSLKKCHETGRVYFDFRPGNMILQKDLSIVLIDGGDSVPVGSPVPEDVFACKNRLHRTKQRDRSPQIAPEVWYLPCEETPLAQPSMDVYSFGHAVKCFLAWIKKPLKLIELLTAECFRERAYRPLLNCVEERLQVLEFLITDFSGTIPACLDVHTKRLQNWNMVTHRVFVQRALRKFLKNHHWGRQLQQHLKLDPIHNLDAFVQKKCEEIMQKQTPIIAKIEAYASEYSPKIFQAEKTHETQSSSSCIPK